MPERLYCPVVGSGTLTHYCTSYRRRLYWTARPGYRQFACRNACSNGCRYAGSPVIAFTSRMTAECFVYCLSTIDEPYQTYIGATMNIDKRLKQHNGILRGGARATSKRPGQWHRICYVKGFDHWTLALSFEWHWKHYSRKLQGPPLERRQKGLDTTLAWAAAKGFPRLEVVYE